jgi:putative acetyltransferase
VNVRDLRWNDFDGWVALYYSRYDELATNPQLGVFTMESRPNLGEESTLFGSVWKQILSGDMVASVAEDEGVVVGLCTVVRKGHREDRHVATLGIAVRPGRRGQGIGTALMRHALAKCDGRFEIVTLAVIAGNEAALRLYRRLGFVERGRLPRTFRRNGVDYDEIIMAKELGRPGAS